MNAKHVGSTLDSLFEELGEIEEVSLLTWKKLTQVANWDGEDASPINPLLWDKLAEFARRVGGEQRPIPSPLPYSAVNLRWRLDTNHLDVEFDGEGVTVTRQDGAQFIVMQNVDEDLALAEVTRFLVPPKSFEDHIFEVVPHGTIRAQVRPATLPLPEWDD